MNNLDYLKRVLNPNGLDDFVCASADRKSQRNQQFVLFYVEHVHRLYSEQIDASVI